MKNIYKFTCLGCKGEYAKNVYKNHVYSNSCQNSLKPKSIVNNICIFCETDLAGLSGSIRANHVKHCKAGPYYVKHGGFDFSKLTQEQRKKRIKEFLKPIKMGNI